ncbi:cation transport protein-domain-containing protein [Flammula alnicola]|nr:cation transport protein-domain-containing protein [Flammula alnicola]
MDPEQEGTNLERGVNEHSKPTQHDGVNTSARRPTALARLVDFIVDHSTFFRIHLAAFTFIPLIFSGIFFASNGRFHVSFVDSMFLCYSAMTVTGLSTVDLSTITVWQQVILRFFVTHCEYVVAKRKPPNPLLHRSRSAFMQTISAPIATFKQREPTPRQDEDAADATQSPQVQFVGPTPGVTLDSAGGLQDPDNLSDEKHDHVLPDGQFFSSSPKSADLALPPTPSAEPSLRSPMSNPSLRSPATIRSPPTIGFALSTTVSPRVAHYHPMMTVRNGRGLQIPPFPGTSNPQSQKYQGFGGFPGPAQLLKKIIKKIVPRAYNKMERTMTLTTMKTLDSSSVPWLNFSGLVVGRNSNFHTDSLTDDQLEDIGGAEYRALRLLSYLVPTYFVLCQLITILFFLPWLSIVKTYNDVFAAQPRLVSKTWFSFFQVMGSYTGGGLSLVDLGMVPFQNAYLMIVALMFAILAGNHALVLFNSWTASKVLPADSEAQEALSFLLEHPRRFPSHQTWFLVVCLVVFSVIEWVSFFILDIGLPAYESIPTGPRVIAGLFQGLAARASGFAIVPLASFAPALQFLYVVMMYIAVAMSIRSTNVYEERSLGVFEAPSDDEDEEPTDLTQIKSGRERVGRYIGWHLRRQLSIDLWWLVWAVFLIAIIERTNLLDDSKKWFDLFRVLFELVSAFGGIGLSLGLPYVRNSVRGRHRGLPVAVDRAVLLPSELVTTHEANTNPPRMDEPTECPDPPAPST